MNIASIDHWANNRTSPLHRASPIGKELGVAFVIAAAILTWDVFLLLAMYVLLVGAVFLSRLPARKVLMIAAYPAIFAVLFVLSRWDGTWVTPATILLKALTAALAMVLLIVTTPYPDVFASFSRALPAVVADALFMTYRSFFVLLGQMERTLVALRLRGGLRPRRYVQNASNVAPALGMVLIHGIDRAQRLYDVLRLRGYRGRIPASSRWRRLARMDWMPLSLGVLVLSLALLIRQNPLAWQRSNGLAVLAAAAVAGFCVALSRLRPGGSLPSAPVSPSGPPAVAPLHVGGGIGGGGLSGDEIVRVSCVKHVYPDSTVVTLCGFDFVVRRGECVVVLGPNGAGKSTLLQHVLGLLRPSEGSVRVFGHDPSREYGAIQRRIGVLLQNADEQIVAPTVEEDVAFAARNLGYTRAESERLAVEAMERVGVLGLRHKVAHYLSGGEKRKVALAGALLLKPELLVLDEPFEGIDPRSRDEMLELLNALRNEGTSLIVTTHDMEMVAPLADVVYLLAPGGHIVTSGPAQEVFKQAEQLELCNVMPPTLHRLFHSLAEKGHDLGSPQDIDDAAQRLLRWFDGAGRDLPLPR